MAAHQDGNCVGPPHCVKTEQGTWFHTPKPEWSVRLTLGGHQYLIVESRTLDIPLELPEGVALVELTKSNGATVISIAELDALLQRWTHP